METNQVFEEILSEQHAATITGVLIVQKESIIHLVETSMDTSTALLRQIQSMEAELDPSARIMENASCERRRMMMQLVFPKIRVSVCFLGRRKKRRAEPLLVQGSVYLPGGYEKLALEREIEKGWAAGRAARPSQQHSVSCTMVVCGVPWKQHIIGLLVPSAKLLPNL